MVGLEGGSVWQLDLVALPEAIITLIRQGFQATRPLGPYLIAGAAGVMIWSASTAGLLPFAF